MTKFKHKKTGKIIQFEDFYLNSGGIYTVVKALYENSNEWIKIYPIDLENISEISECFMEESLEASKSNWTDDFKNGYKKGVEEFLKKENHEKQ